MNEYVKNHMVEIENLISDILVEDSSLPPREQQLVLANIFNLLWTKSVELEKKYKEETDNFTNMVTDIEHLIVFAKKAELENRDISDFIDMSKIPKELRNLSSTEYLAKLGDVLTERRNKKDWASIYRVIKDKTYTIRNFINNMEQRKYDLRHQPDLDEDYDDIDDTLCDDSISIESNDTDDQQPKVSVAQRPRYNKNNQMKNFNKPGYIVRQKAPGQNKYHNE